MKLLHVDSSILGDNSVSRNLSAAVVGRLGTLHPDLEVIRRDLVFTPVAHLTGAYLAGQNADVQHDQALQEELTLGGAVLAEFFAADIVVVASPLYNLTVPSQLKSWMDRIVVAGKTFRYTANGPEGLVHGKRLILVLTRGGHYGPDSPRHAFEHGESYLRSMFAFIGLPHPEVIVAEGLAVGAEQRQKALEEARGQIEALAA